MTFKVPALREEIGNPLDMYSVNRDNSPTEPLFIKGGKKIRILLRVLGKDCELDLKRCELMGGKIMR